MTLLGDQLGRTIGGISTAVASRSQMTPFGWITLGGESTAIQELEAPHLFQNQASQRKRTCTMIAHAVQANEHDGQQDKVRSTRRDDGYCIACDVG